jgi:hypothetical protein
VLALAPAPVHAQRQRQALRHSHLQRQLDTAPAKKTPHP